MTDQHRATPEQWEYQERWASDDDDASCILELRCRVEALELAHRIQSGTLTSSEQAELGVVPVVDLEAAVHCAAAEARDSAMAELRAASAEVRPTVKDSLTDGGGLVERVARSIERTVDFNPDSYAPEACAAIREVAAWLRENDSVCQMGGDAAATAELLEQEASRG
jgi:hypothetical protein